jgi:hypothetical protein
MSFWKSWVKAHLGGKEREDWRRTAWSAGWYNWICAESALRATLGLQSSVFSPYTRTPRFFLATEEKSEFSCNFCKLSTFQWRYFALASKIIYILYHLTASKSVRSVCQRKVEHSVIANNKHSSFCSPRVASVGDLLAVVQAPAHSSPWPIRLSSDQPRPPIFTFDQ